MFFDLARLPSLGGIHTIADIGANIGQSAVSFRQRFPTAEIHCFEPVVESYEKGMAATRRLAKIAWHPVAVSDRELGRYTHLI
jgi:FkbM family methyltransferase